MTAHSVEDEVWQAVDIARHQPLGTGWWDRVIDDWITKPDPGMVEAIRDVVLATKSRLRSVFIGGQCPDVPSDWRIDGLLYKRLDDALEDAESRLERRYRMAVLNFTQAMGIRADARGKQSIDKRLGVVKTEKGRPAEAQWFDAGDYESWTRLRQTGFEVRCIETGRIKRYEARG